MPRVIILNVKVLTTSIDWDQMSNPAVNLENISLPVRQRHYGQHYRSPNTKLRQKILNVIMKCTTSAVKIDQVMMVHERYKFSVWVREIKDLPENQEKSRCWIVWRAEIHFLRFWKWILKIKKTGNPEWQSNVKRGSKWSKRSGKISWLWPCWK